MAEQAKSQPNGLMARLVEAMAMGSQMDLSDCVYGPAHWEGDFVSKPAPYYSFLAGFVRAFGIGTIAELGTHYGGSTIAMCKGLSDNQRDQAKVVTVDITHLNQPGLAAHPMVKRFHGDSLDPQIVNAFARRFDLPVDLLYVDTVHTYRQALENISVYANKLRPKWLILDDIRLNPQMQAMWRDIQTFGVGEAIDVSELAQRPGPGFGLIRCSDNAQWPESSPLRRALLRKAWAARWQVASRMPDKVKDKLRGVMELVRRPPI